MTCIHTYILTRKSLSSPKIEKRGSFDEAGAILYNRSLDSDHSIDNLVLIWTAGGKGLSGVLSTYPIYLAYLSRALISFRTTSTWSVKLKVRTSEELTTYVWMYIHVKEDEEQQASSFRAIDSMRIDPFTHLSLKDLDISSHHHPSFFDWLFTSTSSLLSLLPFQPWSFFPTLAAVRDKHSAQQTAWFPINFLIDRKPTLHPVVSFMRLCRLPLLSSS